MDKSSSWYVYLLKCADDSLYTGITTDTVRRVRQHNGELVGGARYTRPRRPVELVWQEQHADRSSASKRECAIKALSLKEKRRLIGGKD